MNKWESVLVILSGGQDSTTCLYWAKDKFKNVKAISFDYGQKHKIELESAQKVAQLANVDLKIINVQNILRSRSPLTDNNVKLETYTSYDEMDKIIGDRVELTFVPMRNAFFITVAANYALYNNIYNLVTGVCEQDNANYPDCREDFIKQQEKTIQKALGIKEFFIHTPLINKTKSESIKLAKTFDGCMEALSYSHTCYNGTYPPCGKCHSCVLRAQGFLEANVQDPLIVRANNENVS